MYGGDVCYIVLGHHTQETSHRVFHIVSLAVRPVTHNVHQHLLQSQAQEPEIQ